METSYELLRELTEAALAYDRAIKSCADEPQAMSSFCTAQGDDLDTLYFNWLKAAHKAKSMLDATSPAPSGGSPG